MKEAMQKQSNSLLKQDNHHFLNSSVQCMFKFLQLKIKDIKDGGFRAQNAMVPNALPEVKGKLQPT